MILMDAPPELAAVFNHWLDAGMPWREGLILEEFLWPYRGTRLLTDEYVFWLSKRSDLRDEVRVEPRSMPLGPAATAGSGTTKGGLS